MILVIAVMRQAGNPRIYEAFFPASDAPPVSLAAVSLAPVSQTPPDLARSISGLTDDQKQHGAILPIGADFQDANFLAQLQNMLIILGDEKSAQLMAGLVPVRPGKIAQTGLSSRDSPKPADLQSDSEPATEHQPWPEAWIDQLNAAFLQAVGESAENDQPATQLPPDWTDPTTLAHLQAALDRWAIARVDPAAVWKAADKLGFYRLLENDPNRLVDAVASRTSVTSLVQQPDVYLHRRVVLPASVARVILRPAAKNPFSIDQYWEVWLRPRDGSERPLVAFTSRVSPEIAAIPANATLADGPTVWIDGVFLKRIAYQSSLGRELAPAIVGTLHEPDTAIEAPIASTPAPTEGWVLVAVSAAIGCSAAAFIFFFSGKGIARSRQLRQRTVPATPLFVAQLDDPRHRNQTGEHSS